MFGKCVLSKEWDIEALYEGVQYTVMILEEFEECIQEQQWCDIWMLCERDRYTLRHRQVRE